MPYSILDILKSSKREHSYLGSMEPEQVLDENNYKRACIRPHEDYFELRIPETFLQLGRKYWKAYSPMTVVMLRFLHNGERRELPFVISSQSLLANFPAETQGWSEFNNVRALGPFPYEEGDVELAIALYAVESRDYAGELFALTEKLLNTLQVPIASQAFETADVIKGVIEQLTGLAKVSRKLGFYHAFEEDDNSPHRFRDQYLLKINVEQQQINKEKLRIQDGRLHMIDQNGKLERASAWDYCLARIEASDKTTVTELPFWETWQTARRLVNEGNQHMSEIVCGELLRQISMCADLTEKDRRDMPFVFRVKYEQEIERYDKLHSRNVDGHKSSAIGYRSAGTGGVNAGASGLTYSANKLSRTSYPSQIYQGLQQLAKGWNEIPGVGDKGTDDDHTNELIGQQLDQVRTLVHTNDIEPAVITSALTLS